MEPFYERDGITIYCGDNRDVLPHIEPVHAVVTDPPYGLTQKSRNGSQRTNNPDSPFGRHNLQGKASGGFMGMKWDASTPGPEFWQAISAAMLPGAHLLAFGGTRTSHRIAVAIEDAGFELRDTLQWLYGSGFPKSHDVSKAIDKLAGAEREVIGTVRRWGANAGKGRGNQYANGFEQSEPGAESFDPITAPATPEAEQWQGWQTALKPAYEPVIMARKPFKGTVAANVLQHGTGAINVDACRIGTGEQPKPTTAPGWDSINRRNAEEGYRADAYTQGDASYMPHTAGRWPANVILDEEAALQMGEPARYFYCAKASRRERNAGLDGMPEQFRGTLQGDSTPRNERDGKTRNGTAMANVHPTVKPLALMRYLVTLVTPPGGIVLDPFAGSGSTLVAAAELGFHAIGIELSEEYAEIAARRVDHAIETRDPQLALEGIA